MPPAEVNKTQHLLVHVVKCSASEQNCPVKSCDELKRLYVHSRACQKRISGGCVQCITYLKILSEHSQKCYDPECIVPSCADMQITDKRSSFIRRLFRKWNDSSYRRRHKEVESKGSDLEDDLYDCRPTSTRVMGCLITDSNDEPQFMADNPLFAYN